MKQAAVHEIRIRVTVGQITQETKIVSGDEPVSSDFTEVYERSAEMVSKKSIRPRAFPVAADAYGDQNSSCSLKNIEKLIIVP